MKAQLNYLKYLIMFTIQLFFTPLISGQWDKETIAKDGQTPCVDAFDFNLDNKTDVIFPFNYWDGNTLTNTKRCLYENNYPDWIEKSLSGPGVTFMFKADIDGDSLLDIVATFYWDNKLGWFKNNYPDWTLQYIDQNTEQNHYDFFSVADINGDNKNDIVFGPTLSLYNSAGGDFAWYENNPPNWIKHKIEHLKGCPLIVANDIDQDGKMDIFITTEKNDEVIRYETEDKGTTFNKDTIDRNLVNAFGINCGDINGDGIMDLVATTGGPYYSGNQVVWYEYTNNEWSKHIIGSDLDGAVYAVVRDIDGDGRNDVIANGYKANKIVWYKNNETYDWPRHIIDDKIKGPRFITAADINGDDFPDIISSCDDEIDMYTNPYSNTNISIGNSNQRNIRVYPNPVDDLLIIETSLTDYYSIEITSLKAQLLYSTKTEGTTRQLDLSSFQSGVYFITIRSKNFVTTKKIVKL